MADQRQGFDISKVSAAISDFEAILNVLLPLLSKLTGGTGGGGLLGSVSPDDAAAKISAIRSAVEQHTS